MANSDAAGGVIKTVGVGCTTSVAATAIVGVACGVAATEGVVIVAVGCIVRGGGLVHADNETAMKRTSRRKLFPNIPITFKGR